MNNERFLLRSKLLEIGEFRNKYLENIRTLGSEMSWDKIEPLVTQYRKLIEAELKEDTAS
ncbi:MAG: hypothetical protein U0930_15070 [Pirellulales bacterium]